MFVDAIEKVSTYTRPVNTIMRNYGGGPVIPGSATLFFVNDEGVAVTCKHVAEMLVNSEQINGQYRNFCQERSKIARDGKAKAAMKGLELKYRYEPHSTVQLKVNFLDCIDTMTEFTCHLHPTLDLAIIRFKGYNNLLYRNHAVFMADTSRIKQGMGLCRLGFPFPEFSNFRFNETSDDIEWTNEGIRHSPRFPIDGMVTRFLADQQQQLYGIELSTPGLRGQSGGPLFDNQGLVCGMQFSTKHLHLGFDIIDKDIVINNRHKKISDYSFMHLGQCIHADAIKNFLRQHQVKFYEE